MRRPGQGGAKRSMGVGAMAFYASPVMPQGARWGPQYQVGEQGDHPQVAGQAVFIPLSKCPQARRPEIPPRLPQMWLCTIHEHRQCASCAVAGSGMRHSWATGHNGHPRHLTILTGLRDRTYAARVRTPRGRERRRVSGIEHIGCNHLRLSGSGPAKRGRGV